eukprot:3932719-Prorocentrum_lima.AAC.1
MEKMQDTSRAKAFLEDEYIHDLSSSQPRSSLNKCMALTKCRCSSSYGYFSSKRNRPLVISDFL